MSLTYDIWIEIRESHSEVWACKCNTNQGFKTILEVSLITVKKSLNILLPKLD